MSYSLLEKINNPEDETWCIDGEKLENNNNDTYKIETINRVKILVPKKNIKKLFINN